MNPSPKATSDALAGGKQQDEIEVEAGGIWTASSLGFSFHCDCGWVSKRHDTEGAAIHDEVWPHMVKEHRV